ncbi:MAG: HAD family hydrolase [Pirellulaceae bacterium]|nr:HAD family hydrolase [Pirellulaceae bacterium]
MSTPCTSIEVVSPAHRRGGFRAAIVDFDGTLSLLRRNWQDVMIPMMVDILQATGTQEPRDLLARHVEEYVMRLNGKQTIYQMMQLVEEVRARGGTPRTPLEYKHQYHDLLWQQVEGRVEGVRGGHIARDEMMVPGAEELLAALDQRGLTLYLASGTDLTYVRDELAVLGLERYFGPRVYGALDDYRKFSKAMVIARIVSDTGVQGSEILGFGDGFVEIEEVKKVGGVAVGVASNEVTRRGVNDWKRNRLVRAGADLIIGDYRCREELLQRLGLAQPQA